YADAHLDPHSFPTRRSSDLLSSSASSASWVNTRSPFRPTGLSAQPPEGSSAGPVATDCTSCVPSDCRSTRSPCTLAAASIAESRSEEHTSELQSRFDLVCRL